MDDKIQEFLDYLTTEKGSSDNTTAAYRNDLTQFQEYVAGRETSADSRDAWSELTREDLIDYILWLKEREYASATVARKVAAMKSFCGFLLRTGALPDNPADELDSPKVKKHLPTTLTPEEVDQLLAQPGKVGETAKALRDTALLEMLYATGMRVSEIAGLALEDIDLNAGSVRCVGKGNKERVMPLYAEAAKAVAVYLEKGRPVLLGHNADETTLFLNPRGERLTRQGLWLIIKGYARQLGLQDRVTPHTLRHSFATHMLNGGAQLRQVQQLLGHANISTTQVYTHITQGHLREVYDGAHPRAHEQGVA